MYNTRVVFEPSTGDDPPMIDFSTKSVLYESSTFCVEWARQIESDGNPFSVRQVLEDRKITANEDMNTFRRLLHQAETDHYAFYQVIMCVGCQEKSFSHIICFPAPHSYLHLPSGAWEGLRVASLTPCPYLAPCPHLAPFPTIVLPPRGTSLSRRIATARSCLRC